MQHEPVYIQQNIIKKKHMGSPCCNKILNRLAKKVKNTKTIQMTDMTYMIVHITRLSLVVRRPSEETSAVGVWLYMFMGTSIWETLGKEHL